MTRECGNIPLVFLDFFLPTILHLLKKPMLLYK